VSSSQTRLEGKRRLDSSFDPSSNCLNSTAFLGQGLYFLAQQGIEITIATDITLACLVVSAICYPLSSVISNRFGRRFSFVYMSLLHLVVMAVIGFIGFKKGNVSAGWALAVLVNIGISTQALSTAACCYTLSAEIPSLRLRAKTQSLALTVNNTISLVTTLVVPYIFQDPGYLGELRYQNLDDRGLTDDIQVPRPH
jgi:MFS family permease